MVREETRKQTASRPDNVWPNMWRCMSDAPKKKAKQRWAIEKPKLENARQLTGIFFIEPNDEEFTQTHSESRSWKVGSSNDSSYALQSTDKEQWRNSNNIWKRKTKYACVVDVDESTRPRLEGSGHKPHQYHTLQKG